MKCSMGSKYYSVRAGNNFDELKLWDDYKEVQTTLLMSNIQGENEDSRIKFMLISETIKKHDLKLP